MKSHSAMILAFTYIIFGYETHSAYWMIAYLGWGGFGDVSMEYTETGVVVATIVLLFFPIATLALFVSRMIYDFVKKKLKKDWWKELLLCVLGYILE